MLDVLFPRFFIVVVVSTDGACTVLAVNDCAVSDVREPFTLIGTVVVTNAGGLRSKLIAVKSIEPFPLKIWFGYEFFSFAVKDPEV